MNFILFDGPERNNLLPFTYTRPVAEIRVGILSLREKWEKHLNTSTTSETQDYLSEKFSKTTLDKNIKINPVYLPTENLAGIVKNLQENQALFDDDRPIAYFFTNNQKVNFDDFEVIQYTHDDLLKISNTWDIFRLNGEAIQRDFELLTQGRKSQPIPNSVFCIHKENIFLEEGAKVELASLNASAGPIYIGKDAEIMEACAIRGPFALCDHSTLKMGAKIYGPTTVGPHCKVGGEVNNSVFFGYSNKAHDGFLGNSVIGEWCNLGADTNNSNLKNNYAEVRLWNYETENFARTRLQFCGLMMGDHSKCGINTMFNTGTVVGVSANIFGSGFPRNFIPSFSWGGAAGMTTFKTDKAFEVAREVMKRRNLEFDQIEEKILEHVFEISSKHRRN
ncbi:GlmU family protein [uncultured Planktosalinus sp.]|uniref:GlmU family protein n=1 Tax=uncultured Planktosalinus sp. TaxID=1810935 RepID=UPI0030DAA31C